MLMLIPVSLAEANAFVAQHHRHHKPVTGHKFSIGCTADGQLVGVAIVGRPVSRYLDDGKPLKSTAFAQTEQKRLQYVVCRSLAGGAGYGLSENDNLYP